ncbi:PAAR domain-containing protein [Paraburkholderia caffeinilytica]|uniref:PAAR domain-containing protein n=1 Tax=Paraburkholderia caffeinilytica TaxID=1761016 RepID=UPI003DA13B43
MNGQSERDVQAGPTVPRDEVISANGDIRARYLVVTDGAKTLAGGTVVCDRTSAHLLLEGRPVACVGDHVEYADGSRATIVNGAGSALQWAGRPVALAGSRLDNGDLIVQASGFRLCVVVGQADRPIDGLFAASA